LSFEGVNLLAGPLYGVSASIDEVVIGPMSFTLKVTRPAILNQGLVEVSVLER